MALSLCSHGVVEEVLVGEAYAVLEFGLIGPTEAGGVPNNVNQR